MENGRYASQQGTRLPPQASYPVASAPDRYRQAPLTAAAGAASSAAGGSRASAAGYGYAYADGSPFGSSMQPAAVQYGGHDYGAGPQQSPPRAPQQYSPYLYGVGVGGAPGPATASPQYEAVEQYQQNRDSAMHVLGTGFGVAQPPYYESGPTSAPAAALASQTVPSQYPSLAYTAPQSSVGRETLAPAFTTAGMTDPSSHAPAQPPYGQPAYADPPAAASEFDVFYTRYQTELKRTFEHVRDARLSEAAQQLYMLSDWVLHYAETLGLVRDDENHYSQRLVLWDEFNTCWLATLQKQKALTQDMATTGHRPHPPTTLIDYDFLEKMGTQLVKHCDNMEKHGLVDYQMGVWEEEIIASNVDLLPRPA
ncbi:hypothetical protein ACEQ8H_007858 [Pleosporales sp. CAS-2024a]